MILSGKDKGKNGKIIQVMPSDERVVIDGANMRKRHIRPRKQGEKGQIIEKASPMHVSNIMVICGKCNKPTRVGYKIGSDGKNRICKKCDSIL